MEKQQHEEEEEEEDEINISNNVERTWAVYALNGLFQVG